jgi:hypothetical protein
MLLAGCASFVGPGTHAGDPYMVNTQRTLFYSYGPAQASGPDFALSHGDRVKMLSYDYGYSHVAVAATGQSGYVATEDLVPAPPLPKATPGPLLAASHFRRGHAGDDNSRPPTPEEESQIPLPEFPESKPPPGAPSFRY